MNLQTYGKPAANSAQIRASRVILYSARTALNGCFANMAGENYLPITALSGVDWKTCDPTRVKRVTPTQNRQNLNNAVIQSTQNCAEMREGVADFTARLPQ